MSVRLNTHGLDQLRKMVGVFEDVETHVGIFEEKDRRPDGLSNASIGAKHEFGTQKIPRRSFLRMPLETKFKLQVNNLRQTFVRNGFPAFNAVDALEVLGKSGKKTVREAFLTAGFGEWTPIAESTYTVYGKQNPEILVEEGHLKRSIGHRVLGKGYE